MRTLTLFFCLSIFTNVFSQNFTLVTDGDNPIVTDPTIGGTYFGTAWTDINNDGNIDLFYGGTIYKNLGSGKFEVAEGGNSIPTATALVGCSWADYENDGDLDLIYSRFSAPSTLQTRIYRNENGTFTEINSILNTIDSSTWSVQWCDYNNDSYVDFILTFANGFLFSSFPNRLFRGNADGTFSEVIEPYEFLTEKEAYTVSSWIDYDEDGDRDLFIASGPAAGPTGIKSDFIFKNLQIETGAEGFEKASTSELSFAEDLQDGQCYNAIDYDNDGDLDICLTNYSGIENKFYVNDNGTYIETEAPFTLTNNQNLSNAWGDFDNDGDLDVFITGSNPTGSGYYINNGDGRFTESGTNLINTITSGNSTGATVGDYDNDGDLDLFVVGGNTKALLRNDLTVKNTFANFTLIGTESNKAALGARLELTTRVRGKLVTQRREISASNTFMGHNSLRAHFGLGKARRIVKLKIFWPSGTVNTYFNLKANRFYTLKEGNKLPVFASIKELPRITMYPNPSKDHIRINISDIDIQAPVIVKIKNTSGFVISTKTFADTKDIQINTSALAPGPYFLDIIINQESIVKKLIVN